MIKDYLTSSLPFIIFTLTTVLIHFCIWKILEYFQFVSKKRFLWGCLYIYLMTVICFLIEMSLFKKPGMTLVIFMPLFFVSFIFHEYLKNKITRKD